MLEQVANRGRADALKTFKIADVEPEPGAMSGLLDKAKAFGQGQWGAVKDLGANLRGGFGGKENPALAGVGSLAEGMHGPAVDMGQLQRGRALGNLKTLAPTLAAGGAMYLLHRHNQAKREQQARQQQMLMGQGVY